MRDLLARAGVRQAQFLEKEKGHVVSVAGNGIDMPSVAAKPAARTRKVKPLPIAEERWD